MNRPAVFLDRDGTLIDDVGYPRDPAGVRLVAGAPEALARFRDAGFLLAVVSNQSGVGRGLITPDEMDAVHEAFVRAFADAGVTFDAVEYCVHGPDDGCECRKPSPGMILDIAERLGVDLARSFVVGDKDTDAEAGRRAGCHPIRIDRWDAAAERILADGWDAGPMGCGELVLALRKRMLALPPRAMFRLRATDPAAPEDIPAWCRLTGHSLESVEHPHYLIRRRET